MKIRDINFKNSAYPSPLPSDTT